ncbi:MAG TPA: glycosyltransferase family 1 protein, partial [Bryobacteraceae bacterium]
MALDATPLTLASGGLRRYVSELSAALATEYPEDGYVLASGQRFAMPAAAPPNLAPGAGPRTRMERRWWSRGLARLVRRERIDVFHGTNFEVPVMPLAPAVLTLHDLSPWLDRAWHSGAGRVRARTPWLLGLGLATMVITPAEAIRKEAMERFRIPPNRIVAVPEAAAACFRPVDEEPAAAPYFLYAGALEPRKNLSVIVEAWRLLRRRHAVELVLAGPCRDGFEAPVQEPGLRIAGEVPDEELARLYSGAVAFLYPSLYEGFGLP